MTITPQTKTLLGGKTKTYFSVQYRDEFGKRRTKSFTQRRDAKEFESTIGEIVRQKKMAIKAGVDADTAVALKVMDGSLNGEVVDRVKADAEPRTRKVRDAITAFIDACETGRENHKKVRPQTAQAYLEKLYSLRDKYGDVQVGRIDQDTVKEYRDHLVKVCTTAKAAKNRLVVAKMLFDWLVVDQREIKRNPFDDVRIVADDDEVVRSVEVEDIHTDKEIDALMAAAVKAARSNAYTVERCRDLGVLTLMVFCGLRIGEALAMEWAAVDLDEGMVLVKQTLTKKMVINATKTKHGHRRIALHSKAIGYLKIAKARATGPYVSSVNDPDGAGRPMQYRNMKRSLDRLIKDAKITQRGPHALRHYFASKLIDAGYDGMRLKKQMGHSDLAFTDRVYGHLLNKHERRVKDREDMETVF